MARTALRRADTLHAAGRLPEAIAAYHAALARDPTLFEAWYGLGAALLRRRAFAAAAEALRRAVALRADGDGARANLAEALYGLGEVDAAIGALPRHRRRPRPGRCAAMAAENIACIIPGSPAAGNADILAARRQWAARRCRRGRPRGPASAGGENGAWATCRHSSARENWMKPVFGPRSIAMTATAFEIELISRRRAALGRSGYAITTGDVFATARALSNTQGAGQRSRQPASTCWSI